MSALPRAVGRQAFDPGVYLVTDPSAAPCRRWCSKRLRGA